MADFLTNHKPFHIITLFTSYQECRWLKPRGNYSKWRLVLLPRRGSRKVNRGFSCWPSWDMSLMFLIHLKIPIFIETFLHFLGVCTNCRYFFHACYLLSSSAPCSLILGSSVFCSFSTIFDKNPLIIWVSCRMQLSVKL